MLTIINILEKAKYYHESGLVFLDDVTDKGVYFKVGLAGVSESTDGDPEKLVSFTNRGKGWVPNCSCTHGSNQGQSYGCICAHIIACLVYMYRRKDSLKKKYKECKMF